MERDILKDNVGCQDQVLAAFGGFNLVEFRTERDFMVNRVPLSPRRLAELEEHLFLVFSGIKRKASDVVAPQLKRVQENAAALKSMRAMAYEGFDILTGNRPWREFGELLDRGWQAKRTLDTAISNWEINEMYERGRKAGAWGGKILGAGGGGFLLLFAPEAAHPKLRETFADHLILEAGINAPGSQIIFS